MNDQAFGLPKPLGDGLILRWAASDDAEELAEFNFRHHNDSLDGIAEKWLKEWTRDLLSGNHPTTGPGDITVVVDEVEKNRIVSTAALISQVWSYDGIPFGCGRPELIATDESFRRRGLVKSQMEVLHSKSQTRGELIQAITGIPWYYRQFGYEMTVDLGGMRFLPQSKIKDLPDGGSELFRLRQATVEDMPLLDRLYDLHCAPSLLRCVRDDEIWRHELNNTRNMGSAARNRQIIEAIDGQTIGYMEHYSSPKTNRIREIAVLEGQSMREVCWFVARSLKKANQPIDGDDGKPIKSLAFALGRSHPAYEALGAELDAPLKPYAWFIRVPDLTALLSRISSVLEGRLFGSVMAGFNGDLRLNFYESHLKLTFERGKISDIGAFHPKHFFDSDAFFPDLTFLQLLFGYRSLDELKYAHPDCFTEKTDAAVLLPILFPKRPSCISML